MPKTINTAWGTIPMCGPKSYDFYLNSEEVKQLRENTPRNPNCEWLEPDPCVTNQKSFYKRAYVLRLHGKNYFADILYSYSTPVAAKIYHFHKDGETAELRLWPDWSATTAKHFQSFFGKRISKSEWSNMLVHPLRTVYELIDY